MDENRVDRRVPKEGNSWRNRPSVSVVGKGVRMPHG